MIRTLTNSCGPGRSRPSASDGAPRGSHPPHPALGPLGRGPGVSGTGTQSSFLRGPGIVAEPRIADFGAKAGVHRAVVTTPSSGASAAANVHPSQQRMAVSHVGHLIRELMSLAFGLRRGPSPRCDGARDGLLSCFSSQGDFTLFHATARHHRTTTQPVTLVGRGEPATLERTPRTLGWLATVPSAPGEWPTTRR